MCPATIHGCLFSFEVVHSSSWNHMALRNLERVPNLLQPCFECSRIQFPSNIFITTLYLFISLSTSFISAVSSTHGSGNGIRMMFKNCDERFSSSVSLVVCFWLAKVLAIRGEEAIKGLWSEESHIINQTLCVYRRPPPLTTSQLYP